MNLNIVVLAAGQGKRMNSTKPKVLHNVGGKPILQHVLDTAKKIKPNKLAIVYGHNGEIVRDTIDKLNPDNNFIWVKQNEQLGTGHALKEVLPCLDSTGHTLVLYGDVPLISEATIRSMLDKYHNNVIMLTQCTSNPYGYGRVIRDFSSKIEKIIEENDANCDQKAISEINTGFYVFPNKYLANWLGSLSNNNQQQEYYLTDVINIAYLAGFLIDSVQTSTPYEALGVNNKQQLVELERIYQSLQVQKLLNNGVTLMDGSRIDIRGEIIVGVDCVIDVNCIFEGKVILGDQVAIGAGSILKNVTVHNGVNIKPYSIIEDAIIGNGCQIGPFSRVRPGSEFGESVHIGNFVETKRSKIGKNTKVNHLTYIGDAEIGSKVNIGAGCVTCNYDGTNKFSTLIEDEVFIGSGTMMVAPIIVKKGGVIGAGSTITKNTPENQLTIARSKQVTVEGWVKHHKKITG